MNGKDLARMKSNTFYLIKVRFKLPDGNLTDKTYTYKVPVKKGVPRLRKHHEVVVDSPKMGFTVAVVDSFIGRLDDDVDFEKSDGYKWIVQIVDHVKYRVRLDREQKFLGKVNGAKS